jgi:hypothetical protein
MPHRIFFRESHHQLLSAADFTYAAFSTSVPTKVPAMSAGDPLAEIQSLTEDECAPALVQQRRPRRKWVNYLPVIVSLIVLTGVLSISGFAWLDSHSAKMTAQQQGRPPGKGKPLISLLFPDTAKAPPPPQGTPPGKQ